MVYFSALTHAHNLGQKICRLTRFTTISFHRKGNESRLSPEMHGLLHEFPNELDLRS